MADDFAPAYRSARVREAQAFRQQREREWAVWSVTKGRCWYCGIQCRLHRAPPAQRFALSHLLPPSRGGRDDLPNLVPSCHPCRTRKAAQTLEEFRGAETQRRAQRAAAVQHARSQGIELPLLDVAPATLPVVFWGEQQDAAPGEEG
jgi:HNH endonuclease